MVAPGKKASVLDRARAFFDVTEDSVSGGGRQGPIASRRKMEVFEVRTAAQRVLRFVSYSALREEATEAIYWSQVGGALEGLRETLLRKTEEARQLANDAAADAGARVHIPSLRIFADRADELRRALRDPRRIHPIVVALQAKWKRIGELASASSMTLALLRRGLVFGIVALALYTVAMWQEVRQLDGSWGAREAWTATAASLRLDAGLLALIAAVVAAGSLLLYRVWTVRRAVIGIDEIRDHVERHFDSVVLEQIEGGEVKARAMPALDERWSRAGLRPSFERFVLAALVVAAAGLIPWLLGRARLPIAVAISGEPRCMVGIPLASSDDDLVLFARGERSDGRHGFSVRSLPRRRIASTSTDLEECSAAPAGERDETGADGSDLVAAVRESATEMGSGATALRDGASAMRDGSAAMLVSSGELRELNQTLRSEQRKPRPVVVVPAGEVFAAMQRMEAHLASIEGRGETLDRIGRSVAEVAAGVSPLGRGIAGVHGELEKVGSGLDTGRRELAIQNCVQQTLFVRSIWARTIGSLTEGQLRDLVRDAANACGSTPAGSAHTPVSSSSAAPPRRR
jgi:hypothetical protein